MELTEDKRLPFEGPSNCFRGWVDHVRASADSQSKIGAYYHEQGQGGDLCRQSSNHDVDTNLLGAVVFGGGSDASSGALEYEGEKVAGYEQDGVGSWFDARCFFSIHDNNSGEAKIDGSRKKGRTKSQADKVAMMMLDCATGLRVRDAYRRKLSNMKGFLCSKTRPIYPRTSSTSPPSMPTI